MLASAGCCITAAATRGRCSSPTPSVARRVWPERAESFAARPAAAVGSPSGSPRARARLAHHARHARGHQAREMRQHHRVRLRVRRAGRSHQQLAGRVVHGEAGHPGRPAAQERAERHVLADDRPRAAQRRAPPRPGWRAACRAPPSRARARSSRWPTARARAAMPSVADRPPRATASPSARPPLRPGVRWKGVSSAPDSVVGIAATGAPVTPPIALAVSITRPPPSATSGPSPASARSAAEISSTSPGGTSTVRAGSSGALPAARGVVSSVYSSKPCSDRRSGASAAEPSPKRMVRSPSRIVKDSAAKAPRSYLF